MVTPMIIVVVALILVLLVIPQYTTNVVYAPMSEAVASCGAIRSAARAYLKAHGGTFGERNPTLAELGFAPNDLKGSCTDDSNYSFAATPSSAKYTITFTPDTKLMPKGKTYIIDENGVESGTWRTAD